MKTIKLLRHESVEYLTLDRPKVLNAMNGGMIRELSDYFAGLENRLDVRVVVIRGAGRGFSAGLDLEEFSDDRFADDVEACLGIQRRLSRLILAMRRCPQPIVCVLHGIASGGGLALALASDMRIAAHGTRMNAAFIRVGLSACDVGVSYFLPRLVGSSVANELLMTGRFIDGERALATGLISELHPQERLESATVALVEDLLRSSPLGLRLTKEALDINSGPVSLEAAMALEDRQQVLCIGTGEFTARVQAFVNRGADNEPR